tara:strand:+ start:567 stop:818 length:252 start_codon:yes stop_codon:yes gene_type:complete
MAINVIIRTMVAFFALGIVFIIFMPIIYTLAFDTEIWDGMPTDVLANRDNLYSVFLLIPIFGIGGIVLWAYMAATRNQQNEYS